MSFLPHSEFRSSLWLHLAVLVLLIAALALPLNDLTRYFALLLAAVVIFTGDVAWSAVRWLVAALILVAVLGVQHLWPSPRFDEGHNIFMVDGPRGALERGLPADAFRQMNAELDARYPRPPGCESEITGCRHAGVPDRLYGFSADGLYDGAPWSRLLPGLGFSDPVRFRLGVINDLEFNWTGANGFQRAKREPWWRMIHPWQMPMPYFVALRFPAEFAGSRLCWSGELLWQGADEGFASLRDIAVCRTIEPQDVGRTIFGVSITSPLEMMVRPTWRIRLHRLFEWGLHLLGALAILLVLVRWHVQRIVLPLVLIGLGLVVVALHDSSFIGGVRPFDGGDDGLFYAGTARRILQHLASGDWQGALRGEESVYYYGGPGLRYLRALEHLIFGDSFLGYLSLMLAMPLIIFALFRRFFSARTTLALTLVFVAIPVGAAFGSTYLQYVKWAARGFADPAAAVFFLAGCVVLIRPADRLKQRFSVALGAGFLFALALWVRPNLAPGVAVLLTGAGLMALWHRQVVWLTGLCIGFVPVLGMALHNWWFGHVFVLFSSNATITEAIPMPPSAYLATAGELLRLDFAGEHVRAGVAQIVRWLAGPSEAAIMAPLNAAAIVVVVRVALAGRYDLWLRLLALAALVQQPVAWFYLSAGRYYYVSWFLAFIVCAVWVRDEGVPVIARRWPQLATRIADHPVRRRLSHALDRLAAVTMLDVNKSAAH